MSGPRPVPSADTRPFWDGARGHELRLRWCPDCRRFDHPRAPLCRRCLREHEWRAVSGAVRLLAWTVVHRPFTPGFATPYAVAAVAPVEAAHVALDTILELPDVDGLVPGAPGELAFVDDPAGWSVHRFRPLPPDPQDGHR